MQKKVLFKCWAKLPFFIAECIQKALHPLDILFKPCAFTGCFLRTAVYIYVHTVFGYLMHIRMCELSSHTAVLLD